MSEAPSYRAGHLRAADGLRLAWRDYGDPRAPRLPLLCLAGLTRNANDFHDFALALAPRRVVTLDLRGRGSSDWDPSGRSYRPEAYLDDVRQALAARGLGPVVLCGTSLGGFLAMGLGLVAPTALAGVILNDAGRTPTPRRWPTSRPTWPRWWTSRRPTGPVRRRRCAGA
jgi:pimeloyl-ACP methyl ester carboxylesterase